MPSREGGFLTSNWSVLDWRNISALRDVTLLLLSSSRSLIHYHSATEI